MLKYKAHPKFHKKLLILVVFKWTTKSEKILFLVIFLQNIPSLAFTFESTMKQEKTKSFAHGTKPKEYMYVLLERTDKMCLCACVILDGLCMLEYMQNRLVIYEKR